MALNASQLHTSMKGTLKSELDSALGQAPAEGDGHRVKFCNAIAKALSEEIVKHIEEDLEIVGVKVEFPGGTYLMTSFGGFGVTPIAGVIIPGTPIIPFMQTAPLFFSQDPLQKVNGRGLIK
jgi:hypothetical protein|tara:strand:- start:41 stop:406 length:366 start_codon:yes stop_codon:yes gene_type:complete